MDGQLRRLVVDRLVGDLPMRLRTALALVVGALLLLASTAGAVLSERVAGRLAAERDRQLSTTASEEVAALNEYFERARAVTLVAAHDSAYGDFYRQPGGRVATIRAGGVAVRRVDEALGYLGQLYPGVIGEACFIDRGGAENARVVGGVPAPAADLSPDERGNPFFTPTFALPTGEVYQARPYVSPDTHQWVVSNSTIVSAAPNSILHFEVTVESFRTQLARGGGGFAVQVADERTGAVIVDSRVPQLTAAIVIATRVRELLCRPFVLDGLPVWITVSLGIAVFPEHGGELTELLQRADVAMYQAKRTRDGQAVYTPAADPYTPGRLRLAGELRTAVEEGQLTVHYQPLCRPDSGAVFGMEALVRWEHPERGLIAPGEFLPLAEELGLMPAITRFVLGRAVGAARALLEQGRSLRVSVNLSARDLLDPRLVPDLTALLAVTGLPAALLCLEITEQHLITDGDAAVRTLHELRELGLLISVDDYGTGYGGLAYLRTLPVGEVKIDRSFIAAMDSDPASAVIVRSTCQLAHDLGLQVVAEGVENPALLAVLSALDCELVQGYVFARPMAFAALQDWLAETSPLLR